MSNQKSNFKFNLFLLLIVFLFFYNLLIVNANCKNYPDFIEFSTSSVNYKLDYSEFSTKTIYLKENLKAYPLTIKLFFNNTLDTCFESNDDVQFKLFPSGSFVSAQSISTNNNMTIADFLFNLDANLLDSMSSTYSVKTTSNPSINTGIVYLGVDEENPVFTQFSYQPTTKYIESNTTINIDYVLQDLKSGLKSFQILEVTDSLVDLDGVNTYTDSFSEVLDNSKTYTLVGKDMLSNEISKQINYTVDNVAPQMSNFKIKEYSKDSSKNRFVSFQVEVKDESFKENNPQIQVNGDFSFINSDLDDLTANCVKSSTIDDLFVCSWTNLKITEINSTKNLNFLISAEDGFSNDIEENLNLEIFYDSKEPEITEFYLENSFGVKNIFSAYDDNVSIYLNFIEESVNDNIMIVADFDGLEYFVSNDCNIENNNVDCVWNLGNSLSKYSGNEKGSLLFKVTIIDTYGNTATKDLNISYNNVVPKITAIELIEVNSIKDGIVSSKEEINFKIFIEDDNLNLQDSNFIFADFSSIDYRDGMKKKGASCGAYNQTTTQCDFKSIIADYGYMNRTIKFYVIDTAGNVAIESFNVEVFKVGNESPKSFEIDDIVITNILNRNVLSETEQTAWFEGEIKKVNLDSDSVNDINFDEIKLINYQLLSCNDSSLNPILIGNRVLYPKEIVRGVDNKEPDYNFNLKIDVHAHPNLIDMQNDKKMKCKLSVLKRDNQTVFPAEIVEFDVVFQFYALPYDNLLKTHANSLLDEIDDVLFLDGYFDDIYAIYSIFDKVCSIISSAGSVMSMISNVWVPISWILYKTGYGAAPAQYGDNVILPANGKISNFLYGEDSIIKKMCDFVTCRNGGLLSGFWSETKVGDIASKLSMRDILDGMTSNMCGVASAPPSKAYGEQDSPGDIESPKTK